MLFVILGTLLASQSSDARRTWLHRTILRKREDGKYEITPQGKDQVQWLFGIGPRKPQSVEDRLNEISGYASYLEDLARTTPAVLLSLTAPAFCTPRELPRSRELVPLP